MKKKKPIIKKKNNSIRLDQLLVEKNFIATKSKAQALILAGKVYVNGVKVEKSGTSIKGKVDIEVREKKQSFVSRGGLKLEKAINHSELDLTGLNCLDVGVSTGGFTHCMLKYGAKHVTGVDVGYGQVDLKIKDHSRVTIMERTNFRHSTEDDFEKKFDFFSMDVSFISTGKLFPALCKVLKDEARGIILLKPQFEAGKDEIGKGGVVRNPETHKSVIDNFREICYKYSYKINNIISSPIQGRAGNIEYLAFVERVEIVEENSEFNTSQFVDETFNFFRSSENEEKKNSDL